MTNPIRGEVEHKGYKFCANFENLAKLEAATGLGFVSLFNKLTDHSPSVVKAAVKHLAINNVDELLNNFGLKEIIEYAPVVVNTLELQFSDKSGGEKDTEGKT